MPYRIPFTSEGKQTFLCNVGPVTLRFTAYYVPGPYCYWFMNIDTLEGTNLVRGIKLVPGTANMLKGLCPPLHEYEVLVILERGQPSGDPYALGDTLNIYWFNPGEQQFVLAGDPMDYIGFTLGILGGS